MLVKKIGQMLGLRLLESDWIQSSHLYYLQFMDFFILIVIGEWGRLRWMSLCVCVCWPYLPLDVKIRNDLMCFLSGPSTTTVTGPFAMMKNDSTLHVHKSHLNVHTHTHTPTPSAVEHQPANSMSQITSVLNMWCDTCPKRTDSRTRPHDSNYNDVFYVYTRVESARVCVCV